MNKDNIETVFLTVGTSEQKLMSEKLIDEISRRYSLDINVVCDGDYGSRIGSGGALLNVIEKNYDHGRKLLVINSGGMSKRSINYSVRGKIFANLMYEGNTVSLLELLVKNAKRVLDKITQGVIVCCSDILVNTENIENTFENNAGLCVKTDFETGSRHGVMLCDDENIMQEYPHKINKEDLEKKCKEYNCNCALVDTGFIYFNDGLSYALKKTAEEKNIIKVLSENKIDLNLYPEIIALLAEKINKDEFLFSSLQNDAHLAIRKILFDVISPFSLEVRVLEKQKFVHMGTLKESLDNIIEISGERDSYLKLNSFVPCDCVVGENTVLDNVILESGCKIGSGCIVSDISLDKNTVIGDNKALCGIKLCDGSFVSVMCDINENPKEKINGTEIWNIPRFYKGSTYAESLMKLLSSSDEEKISLEDCTRNADASYYLTRVKYIGDMISYKTNPEYIKLREKIISNFFENKNKLSRLESKKNKVLINLPVRVNLSGTWTDAMPYCTDNGGEVVNIAVNVDGEKPIWVELEKLDEKVIEFRSENSEEVFEFKKTTDDLSDFNLHRAVLQTIGIDENTVIENGFRLTTKVLSIDKGSGLGTSSILLSGCFKAFNEMFCLGFDEDEILRMVFVAEQIMKTGGGWQDQAGGIFPGVKVTSSSAGPEQKLTVKEITVTEKFKIFFSEKVILVPTGQRHFGRFIVGDVVNRYLEKNEESLYGHKKIKELNFSVIKSIEENDSEGFINCLNEHFRLLRKISPEITNEKIDELVKKLLENCADAVSICGAGGGGYLLAVLKEDVTAEKVQQFIENNFEAIGGKVKRLDISY
ncbi:MAG: hypothetical protein IJ279_06635 [Clostridia bacterium]|nr:hypothetical protein [Clostridia bacterium]